ncbi:MAG: ADP-ribosylglycohydrolase family protein [Anaerolineae bacterium]|jgi:poly(ADP-ribose) glycohydrolase ARH3|nr:ADP-ribosylglycohydrolase family protein [Anaerolineae bacterium]MDH7474071.1 ADP-ribosylglycohydrolase family protein [Anaerolineae bacterium]
MIGQVDRKSKFLGGMVGSALGDAIGELAFRGLGEAELRAEIERRSKLVYTDDTAMAIGLAESIVQTGRLDEQYLGDTFRTNFEREPWRGYASGPPTVFHLVERYRISYSEAARSLFGGQGSFGNGAAMRIAPVGLFFHDAPDLYEQACISAVVTHAHPIGMDGAAVLACAVAQAVKLDPQTSFPFENFWQGLIEYARTPAMQDKLKLIRMLIAEDVPPFEAAENLGRSVAVHESLPFALYAFFRHPGSFEECLFCAILHGGDRDTLGAMACAVSGAYLGIEAIPAAWREKLENGRYIEELAFKLAEMSVGRVGNPTR